MIRRTFEITVDQAGDIARLAKQMGLDKSQVASMAIGLGLVQLEDTWNTLGKPNGLEIIARALRGSDKGSINTPSAKRR